MLLIATELEHLINQHLNGLRSISEKEMMAKPNPSKWSKKEIIGHLADSAQNNIRRFVVAQYENNPQVKYDQDKWVAIAGYQQYDTDDVIDLWFLLNKHMVAILKNTSSVIAQRTSLTEEMHTIEWLAIDYIKHLKHHLHQVLELEPILYP
ncbi:MAG: DinB family protein [Chitinophagaceae bacterium]